MSRTQIDAVKKANRLKPAVLTPEMILRRGNGHHRSLPLGIRPETKKRINFMLKFLRTAGVAFALSAIVLDVLIEPSWVMFASICLKLLSVVLSGFDGYKFGYENIVVDTVNYMSAQADLMEQAKQYIDTNEPDESMFEDETSRTYASKYDKTVLDDPEWYWTAAKQRG